MKRITSTQLNKIIQIIKDHMSIIGHVTTGVTKPPANLMTKLGLSNFASNLVTTAYQYGSLGISQGKNLATTGISKVNQLLKKITLPKSQQQSVDQLQMKAQQSIDSLTQRIITGITTTILNDDLKSWAVPHQLTGKTQQLLHQLKSQTEGWKKDWNRIAQTEMWDAKLQGEAETIINKNSSSHISETLVYKLPAPGACAKCKQLYLERDGVTPKVFKMADLLSNGTNTGKAQSDWIPTLGVVHPNCMCSLNVKPKGTKFDGSGNLVPDK